MEQIPCSFYWVYNNYPLTPNDAASNTCLPVGNRRYHEKTKAGKDNCTGFANIIIA